jgi:hypothetical protein
MLKHSGQISRALCGRSFAPRSDARLPLHDGPFFLTDGHERKTILLAALPGRAEAALRKLPSPLTPHPGITLWFARHLAICLKHHRELGIRRR